jgi:hypothetical protein
MEVAVRLIGRGWGRNMGTKTIADIDINNTDRSHSWDNAISWNRKKYKITEDGIEFSWGDALQIAGRYMLWLEISKTETLRLFKRLFGKKFTREELEKIGIVVTGLTPTNEELESSIKNIKVSELMSIIMSSPDDSSSSEEIKFKPKPLPRLVSSASEP